MEIEEKIKRVFSGYEDYSFDPSECLQQCITILEQACHIDGECDPRTVENAERLCNAYGCASNLFLQRGLAAAAKLVLTKGWDNLSLIQASEKRRVYRAGIGMYLAKVSLSLGDKGGALRWGLLTQADDLLGQHPSGGGAGRQMLQTVLGMSETALAELMEVASCNLRVIKEEAGDDWSDPHGYAEDAVTRFAFRKPDYSQLFAMASEDPEFPLNTAYFRGLLEKVNSNAISSKEKGDWLEDLAAYLFLLIPGLVPRRNLLEETMAFETDVVVRNLSASTNIFADLLGRHFLVECKNWETPVGVQDIGYFLYRVRLTHARFGVILAKSGITGDKQQERAAYSLIRKAFHEDGTTCIVIDNRHLARLADRDVSLWSVVLEGIERMRFGKAS